MVYKKKRRFKGGNFVGKKRQRGGGKMEKALKEKILKEFKESTQILKKVGKKKLLNYITKKQNGGMVQQPWNSFLPIRGRRRGGNIGRYLDNISMY